MQKLIIPPYVEVENNVHNASLFRDCSLSVQEKA
jgi:hypothetical protein